MLKSNSYEEPMTYIKNRISELQKRANKIYNTLTKNPDTSSIPHSAQLVDNLISVIDDIIYYADTIEQINYESNQSLLYQTLSKEVAQKIYLSNVDRRAKVTRTLTILDTTILKLKKNPLFSSLALKLEDIKRRETIQLENLNFQIKRYERKPDLTDGEIDIYLEEHPGKPQFRCSIYLHNIPIEIGGLEYRGPVDISWLGDIGYDIYPPFRGHNYAYKALNLVKDKIVSRGIDSVIITTDYDNIPSQRTIEKFGGQRIPSDIEHVYRYRCDLTLHMDDSKKVLK